MKECVTVEIRVNATRQELTRLKNRVKMARRGHKLLKDKRDQLMKEFLAIVHENKRLREELERRLDIAYKGFAQARALLSPPVLEEALMGTGGPAELSVSYRHIMNVVVPEFKLSGQAAAEDGPGGVQESARAQTTAAQATADQSQGEGPALPPYSLASTSADLDDAIREFRDILPLLVKLSEIEHKIQLLADEIERTRRRVNALEYVLIPELEHAVKNVEMRLEEMDRSNVSRLMKIKEIVRAH